MSLNSAASASATVKLIDATQYPTWSVWTIGLFQQERLLEDLKTTMPHYPLGGPAILKEDADWWARKTKEATIKTLKEDGITRPPLKEAEEFDVATTTLDKKNFEAKEKKLVKIYTASISVYQALFEAEFHKSMIFLKGEKRRYLYQLIKASLGDHYSSAIKVAAFGDPSSLLQEVQKFMPSDVEARRGALICKFWEATFEVEGENDVQVWINYISTSVHDLGLLGETISAPSMISRLQTPLPIAIFSQYTIANAAKGLTFADAVEALRVFSQNASVASQLKQLSSTRRHRPEGSVFGAAGQRRGAPSVCFDFANGLCERGAECKFLHTKSQDLVVCKHCGKHGHAHDDCWTKFPEKRTASRNRKPRDGYKSTSKPVKGNGMVMQLIQDAVDNKRESVDLATLMGALKERPARLFTFTANESSHEHPQLPDVMELAQSFRRREALACCEQFGVGDSDDDTHGVPCLVDSSDSDDDSGEDDEDRDVTAAFTDIADVAALATTFQPLIHLANEVLRRERGVARTVTGVTDSRVPGLPISSLPIPSGTKRADGKYRLERPDCRGAERPDSLKVSESDVASESIELQEPLNQSMQFNQCTLAVSGSADGIYAKRSRPAAVVANALCAPTSYDCDELRVDDVFTSAVAFVPPGGVLKQSLGATADDNFSTCSPPMTIFGNMLSEPASPVCDKFAGSRENQPLADGGVLNIFDQQLQIVSISVPASFR